MKQTIRNLSVRARRAGPPLYVWQPGPTRRRAGWKAVALKMSDGSHAPQRIAISQAHWLNAILDAWAADKNERVAALLDAWMNGDEVRDDGHMLSQCPFVQPPMPESALLPAPQKVRSVVAMDLWGAFTESKEYSKLTKGTRRHYEMQFSKIIEWLDDDPVERLTPAAACSYFEMLDKPATAALRLATARRVFSWSIKRNIISMMNPFSSVEIDPPKPRIRIWTDAEIEASIELARKHGRHNLAFAIELGLSTAQRPSDLCRLADGYRVNGNGWKGWRIKQIKTGKIVEPIPDPHFAGVNLIERLDDHHASNLVAVPNLAAKLSMLRKKSVYEYYEHIPYLIRENGLPHTPATLALEWREFRPIVAKEVPSIAGPDGTLEARLQDLRDTAITSMSVRGFSTLQICAQSGHEPAHVGSVLKHYVAMTGDLASSALRMMATTAKD